LAPTATLWPSPKPFESASGSNEDMPGEMMGSGATTGRHLHR
jgi:hypothetical protein